MVVANAVVLALYWIPWLTRKPFLRQLDSIKPGMSVEEATRIMREVSVDSLTESHRLYFRHSAHDPRVNTDWGIIDIQYGKVVSV